MREVAMLEVILGVLAVEPSAGMVPRCRETPTQGMKQ